MDESARRDGGTGTDYVDLGMICSPISGVTLRDLPMDFRRGDRQASKVCFHTPLEGEELDAHYGGGLSRLLEGRVLGDDAARWALDVHASRIDSLDRWGHAVVKVWATIERR